MMHTTNTIESINSQFKKISRFKAIFPTDESLEKILRILVIIHPEQAEKYM